MSDFQVIVTLLVGLSVSVMGWYYSRRIGLAQAEAKLLLTLREQISALESSRMTHERMTAAQMADLEKRLELCEQRWKTWTQKVGD